MHEYIGYEEAVGLLDQKKVDSLEPSRTVQQLIDDACSSGEVFVITHGGGLLFEKDSFLFSLQGFLKDSEKDRGRIEAYYKRTGPFLEHISTLERVGSDDGYDGDMAIDGIRCPYRLDTRQLAMSLEADGVYGILNGACGVLDCCGREVQVMHLPCDIVAWTSIFNAHNRQAINSDSSPYGSLTRTLLGFLAGDADVEGRCDSSSAKQVHILPPLWFSKADLIELLEG